MLETIINGILGLENGGIVAKMSTLVLSISEIWSFYPF
jgi:hypothetical protein